MYHTLSSEIKVCLLLTQCIYVFRTILCTANSLIDVTVMSNFCSAYCKHFVTLHGNQVKVNTVTCQWMHTGWVEAQLYSFFNLRIRCGVANSMPCPPARKSPGNRCTGGWRVRGPCGRVFKISPSSGFEQRTMQPVGNRYTDRAIPVRRLEPSC